MPRSAHSPRMMYASSGDSRGGGGLAELGWGGSFWSSSSDARQPALPDEDETDTPSNRSFSNGVNSFDAESREAAIHGSSSSGEEAAAGASFSSSAWMLQLHPSLKRKFKSPARIHAPTTTGVAAASSSSAAAASATHGVGALASSVASSCPSSVGVSASPASSRPKPIRFVKSSDVINGVSPPPPSTTTTTSSHVGVTGLKLVRAPPLLARPASSTSSLNLPPSHSSVKLRRPVSSLLSTSASSSARAHASVNGTTVRVVASRPAFVSPALKTVTSASAASSSRASTVVHELAHIFRVTYSQVTGGKKKKHHREGYLHLFRASTAEAATSTSTIALGQVVPSATSQPTNDTPSFAKSRLSTDRGVVVEELLGRSVMFHEDPATTKARTSSGQHRHNWRGDEVDAGIDVVLKRRRVEAKEEEEEKEPSGEREEGSSSSIHAFSSHTTDYLRNKFCIGEFVVLGEFECELEEEVPQEEYDLAVKLTSESTQRWLPALRARERPTRDRESVAHACVLSRCALFSVCLPFAPGGVLSSAPLSFRSSQTRVTITGAPLPESNIGFRLLAAQGLAENDGRIGKAQHERRTALREPLPLVYTKQDVKPGIGWTGSIARTTTHSTRGRGGGHRGGAHHHYQRGGRHH